MVTAREERKICCTINGVKKDIEGGAFKRGKKKEEKSSSDEQSRQNPKQKEKQEEKKEGKRARGVSASLTQDIGGRRGRR